MPNVITEWTRLLETTTNMSADCTMPTIAAGSNRMVLICIRARSGGGTVSVPASITCNGVTANREAGDSVTRNRVALGVYVFREADLATISGQTISSIAEGTSSPTKSVHYKLIGDCDQGDLAAVGNDFNDDGGSSAGNLSISLARLENSWTEALSSSEGGFALTLTNPSRDGEMYGTGTSDIVNYGSIESETAGTSAFTSTRVYRATALAINIAHAEGGPEITAVNGDDTVSDASSGNTVTTSLGLDSVSAIVIRDADLNETAGSSIAGSGTDWTFATPALADRSAAYYGSATLVLTGVYDSDPVELEFPITFNQPSGLDLTTLAADPDTSDQAVGYGIVTIAEGGQYVFDNTEAEIFNDALGYTIGDQSTEVTYVYDGTMTVFTLLTGSEASADGFTAQGFTSQGFTAQGFTARGFA